MGTVFDAQIKPDNSIDLSLGDSARADQAVLLRISADSVVDFDVRPEKLYVGKTICAFGAIEMIDQRLVMEIDSPEEVVILGNSGPSSG